MSSSCSSYTCNMREDPCKVFRSLDRSPACQASHVAALRPDSYPYCTSRARHTSGCYRRGTKDEQGGDDGRVTTNHVCQEEPSIADEERKVMPIKASRGRGFARGCHAFLGASERGRGEWAKWNGSGSLRGPTESRTKAQLADAYRFRR